MYLLAASENPVTVELMPLITAVVVFLIAFMILRAKVWPKITGGLDERNDKIRDEIRSAEEAREQAKAALAEYEQSLATARQEASEMIAHAKATAKAAGEELRKRNEEELADLKQRATRDIDAAKHAAIGELHTEASSLAAAIASKILSREITAADHERLLDESLRELQPVHEG